MIRPTLHTVDWLIIGAYAVLALALGSLFVRRASRNVEGFFVGDRKLPWWLAGTSIVATTFAADTPLAVTGIVAVGGISGNWLWWTMGIAHIVATFLFARMWRRSGVITDAEITELRYHGRPAAALRAFKAVYFGIFINCLTMAWVIAAMVKVSLAFFDIDPALVIAACVTVSVLYTTLGGFRSVVFTDLIQFVLGVAGAIVLALMVVNAYGGLGQPPTEVSPGSGMLGALSDASAHAGEVFDDIVAFVPDQDHPMTPWAYFIVLLIAGWWRQAEGNGYLVQRLAACKDEGHAQGASLWFSIAHNSLRPWPWILVALGALVAYPKLAPGPGSVTSADRAVVVTPAVVDIATGGTLSITGVPDGAIVELAGQRATVQGGTIELDGADATGVHDLVITAGDQRWIVPGVRTQLLDREMAYPLLMGQYLPMGLLGLVIASLLAAFMSTIDTHTNWGASYLVRDVYQRFIRPDADERHYVTVSRLCIVLMGTLAGITALFIQNIATVWQFLITLGAGLGSVTAARWYWSRVTPHAEFAALGVTTVCTIGLLVLGTPTLFGEPNPAMVYEVPAWVQIVIIAVASLATWIPVSLFGPQNDPDALRRFADKVRPPGPGWREYRTEPPEPGELRRAGLRILAGLGCLYGVLFGLGEVILGTAAIGLLVLLGSAVLLAWIIRSG